jgi:hypothetical protein
MNEYDLRPGSYSSQNGERKAISTVSGYIFDWHEHGDGCPECLEKQRGEWMHSA